jgi:hypothetical protein
MPRSEANRIMTALKNKMEHEHWFEKGCAEEKPIQAIYDVPAMKPKQEYLHIYEQAKTTLAELGFHFSRAQN